MDNPYKQVALTYVRHLFSSKLIGIGLTCFFIIALVVQFSSQFNPYQFFLCMSWDFLFLAHLLEQFTHPRMALSPHARRIHIHVAIVVCLILLGVQSVGSYWSFRTLSFAEPGVYAFLLGIVLWNLSTNIPVLGVIIGLVPLLMMFPNMDVAIKPFFSGHYETEALFVFLVGLALAASGLARVFTVQEGTRLYDIGMTMNRQKNGRASQSYGRMEAKTEARGWKDRLQEWKAAGLARHARRASESRWSSVCRWGLESTLDLCLRLLWISFFGGVCCYLMNPPQSAYVLILFFFSVLPISGFYVQIKTMHHPSREVLLPVTRESYFRQAGLSMGIQYLLYWLLIYFVFTVFCTLQEVTRLPLSELALLGGIGTLLNIFLFGCASG